MRRQCAENRGRRFIGRVIFLLSIALALFCISTFIRQTLAIRQGESAKDRMRDLFEDSAQAEELNAPPANPDFAGLRATNPDTVGLLVAGEDIWFAVVQRDNEYYLSHDFFNKSAYEGTAFMDEGCCIWPEDSHYIIHGHNMRNGTVFGTLKRFRDADYLAKYYVIRFDTLYREAQYVPIAIFDMSAEPDNPAYMDLQQFTFESDDAFMAFVDDARSRSIFDIPIDVEPGDRLLSLVTCSYSNDNGRLVVMGRALREGESAETYKAVFDNLAG